MTQARLPPASPAGRRAAIEIVHGDRLDEHLTELARHYVEAAIPGRRPSRAVSYAVRAGDAAIDRLALMRRRRAAFRLAVDLIDRPVRRRRRRGADPAARLRLGEAQRQAGDPAHRETLLMAGGWRSTPATPTWPPPRLWPTGGCRLARYCGRRSTSGSTQLQAADRSSVRPDGPELARLLAQLGFELASTGDWSRRVALSDRAVAMARRLDDPATLADVLVLRSDTIDHPGTLDERLRLADEQVELLETGLNEPALSVRAFLNGRGDAGFEAGRLDLVDERLDRAERVADDVGQSVVGWQVKVQRAKRLMLAGRLSEAGEVVGAAFQLGQAGGQPDAPLVFAVQHLSRAALVGRLDEVLPLLSEAVNQFGDHRGLLAIDALGPRRGGPQ